MIKINSVIFRDYDIRGTYPDQLNEDTFYILGKAIAAYLQVKTIAVGHDTRLSSPTLFQSLTQGILDSGVDVVSLGLISTEIHYFASGKYGFDANVIISASHNPPQYNGIKIVTKGVVPLHGGFGLPKIKVFALSQQFPGIIKKGNLSSKSILNEWITHALSFINLTKLRKMKVVVDAGNGMGGISWQQIKGKIPCEIIPLYFEPDGKFPHHLPDPLDKKNLSDLKTKIRESGADIGFALDGDADRLFVLDDKGDVLSGTLSTAILSQHLLKRNGPATVLYNVVCGRIVPETIIQSGGKPLRVRVGHSFIKETMKKENALFAGEHSGHFYFRDNFYADSSLIAGLLMLDYLSENTQLLSVIRKKYEKYSQSGEMNFLVRDVVDTVGKLATQFPDADSMDHIDGLSIWYKDWWCNIRSSKTEPLLRLNVGADNDEVLQDAVELVEDKIKGLGGERQ